MSLPIYQSGSKDLLILQTNWAAQINPVIDSEINQGIILKNVALINGTTVVNHKLGRKLQGWFPVRQRALANIYDQQDTNSSSQLTLILVSDAAVTVDLFVF
jgi:hypothetical protein